MEFGNANHYQFNWLGNLKWRNLGLKPLPNFEGGVFKSFPKAMTSRFGMVIDVAKIFAMTKSQRCTFIPS